MLKQKAKNSFKWAIKKLPLLSMCLLIAVVLDYSVIKTTLFVLDPVNQEKLGQIASVNTARAEREFNYLDKVPAEVVKEEIRKQSKEFGLSEKLMLNLADCESDFKNWEKNPKSTAKGVYQWIASSWDATTSGKARISPYDYRANIGEAMIKIANGEYSHWSSCLK